MRPARIIATVALATAVVVTGCSAHSTATDPSQPSAAAAPPAGPTTRPASGGGPAAPPSTASPSGGRPVTGRCDASALAGSVQGTEGAAGTIWTTIRLRNASARTCTVKGIPGVRLLGARGQPVTAPSLPGGPAGSLVVLRPGQAAQFTFSEPNACDRFASGSRLLVTLPKGQGSLVVPLGGQTRYGTCSSVRVRSLQAATTPPVPAASPLADRISDPQVAADRLVAAWLGGDRAAARKLTTTQAVTDRLFGQSPPAHRPAAQPCRLADPGLFLCSYPLTAPNELSVWVTGGASAGYGVSGVEFVD
jgi:Protein of unknown function (DUF4232)